MNTLHESGLLEFSTRAAALRRQGAATVAATLLALGAVGQAAAHPSSDPLHGGQGSGVAVIGHSDLGGEGLNGHVEVLDDHAYVGVGTNGGFAAQWNSRPKCDAVTSTVKVVSLVNPADPTVVSRITLPGATYARAVSAINVRPAAGNTFSGALLAVALEKCGGVANALSGVQYYDVSNPASPVLLSYDSGLTAQATRDVSLVQRPDGRVFALDATHGGGITMVDVSNPRVPTSTGTVGMDTFFSDRTQGCRPFGYAQGVTTNQAGSKAYAAYGDQGLLRLDLASGAPTELSQTRYPAEEGNSFRFVPNEGETAALATDEDLNPAKTTLTVSAGPAAGVFPGCEAIWGNPLYQQATPSLPDKQVVHVPNGGCPADYTGRDVTGKIVLLDRTGSGDCFSFDGKARIAQGQGALAVIVANTSAAQPVFSPDAAAAGDAGVTIPFVMISKAAGDAIKAGLVANPTLTATLADTAETWGALRIFDLSGANPTQTSVFNAPHTTTLTPGKGLYHAVNAIWAGEAALVAWMSDGLRVVDLRNRSAPQAGAFYVPPAVRDPSGNYPTVPLVVGVARHGTSRTVITDINGGLYVLGAASPSLPSLPSLPSVPTPGTVAGCPTAAAGRLFQGTGAVNRIIGTSGIDRILAGAGDDSVDGRAGDDCIDLGTGSDRGLGGSGNDLVRGDRGRDGIFGNSGSDRLGGGPDADRINGGAGNDSIFGDSGTDLLGGSLGNDRLLGGSGADRIFGDPGRDRIAGGASGDRISGGRSADLASGNSGNDLISGNSGNDRLDGGIGHDRILGGTGRDALLGRRGNDRIDARDRSRDRIDCGSGRDLVRANRFDRVARNCERVLRTR